MGLDIATATFCSKAGGSKNGSLSSYAGVEELFGPNDHSNNGSSRTVLGLQEETWLEMGLVDLSRATPWYQGVRLIAPDVVVLLLVLGSKLLGKAGGAAEPNHSPRRYLAEGTRVPLDDDAPVSTVVTFLLLFLTAVLLPSVLPTIYVACACVLLLRWSKVSAALSGAPLGARRLSQPIVWTASAHTLLQYAFQMNFFQSAVGNVTAKTVGLAVLVDSTTPGQSNPPHTHTHTLSNREPAREHWRGTPPSGGGRVVGAPHQCSLGAAACYLLYLC